jgi:hypothetical protein
MVTISLSTSVSDISSNIISLKPLLAFACLTKSLENFLDPAIALLA